MLKRIRLIEMEIIYIYIYWAQSGHFGNITSFYYYLFRNCLGSFKILLEILFLVLFKSRSECLNPGDVFRGELFYNTSRNDILNNSKKMSTSIFEWHYTE